MGQKGVVNSDPVVIIGRVGAPYGVKGWVHVQSFTKPTDNLLNYKTWYLRAKSDWIPIEVVAAKLQGKNIVALLDRNHNRETVQHLTNSDIGIPHSLLPPLKSGEYYWADIIGLTVSNEENIELGQVVDFFTTGANDVMVVRDAENKQHLIPYVPEMFILDVDLARKQIRVRWDAEF